MRDVRMRGFRERVSVAEAQAKLEARARLLPSEIVPLREAAFRVAAEDIASFISVPHFRRAAMDGYALCGEQSFGASAYAPVLLRLIGEVRPATPSPGPLGPGEAVRIATGAPLPEGADAVLMAEHAEAIEQDGDAWVRIDAPVPPGKHVGAIGEDIPQGAVVLRRGRLLRPQDVGVLASIGVAKVHVVARPKVRILITGDEILPPGERPRGSFITDANGPMLEALAHRDGAGSVAILYVPDRRELLREALASATEDVVLLSGGSSVGPEDHAPFVLAEIGELLVHGVSMRPSSPAGFGFFGPNRAQAAFLLPGNPVSCLAAYEFFAGPHLRALGGRDRAFPHRRLRALVGRKIVSALGRTDYVRVALEGERVVPILTSGASILSSTTQADGVVLVDADCEGYGEGEWVTVLLYDEHPNHR